jgi:hypothetical protein
LLARLAAIFAGLPPSSSDLAERKSVVRHLLLQIGGANIVKPPASSSLADEEHVCSPPFARRRRDWPTLAA